VIHVGANPPYIGVLFRPNVVSRHTFENIIETGIFTLNHIAEEFVHKAHQTSARWQESEFQATGLKEEYLFGFGAPFVKESRVKAACELNERIDLRSNGTHFLVAEIKHLSIPQQCLLEDGFIDIEQAGTITVSGLDSYHSTEKIARLPYAKPGKQSMEV
jgi:flavin reductase (DIM6/NTAB) family NADH-FMN oxidoreductase RutF